MPPVSRETSSPATAEGSDWLGMMSGAGAPTETTMRQGRWKSGRDGPAVHQGGVGGRRPAVDGRGDGNRAIELVGQG